MNLIKKLFVDVEDSKHEILVGYEHLTVTLMMLNHMHLSMVITYVEDLNMWKLDFTYNGKDWRRIRRQLKEIETLVLVR